MMITLVQTGFKTGCVQHAPPVVGSVRRMGDEEGVGIDLMASGTDW